MENYEKLIKDVYFDIEWGLTTNWKQIYQKLNKKVPLKIIKEIIEKIQSKQTKAKTNEKQNFIPIVANPDSYMMDLTFYNDIKSVNNGYGTIMNIININSRFLYSYLMKDKKSETIISNFNKFLNDLKKDNKTIELLEADSGKEYWKQFQKLCEDNNIKLILFNSSISKHNTAIVERVNKW